MRVPSTNLGQSQFQDVAFVVGAQCTSYRKLRQIQLEMRSLEDAIKHHEFTSRKNKVKIERLLKSKDELDLIEAEELQWSDFRSHELLMDAKARYAQFEEMLKQTIEAESAEYWANGYEQAELEYWPKYFGKKMALEIAATGNPSLQTAEQVSLLPETLKREVLKNVSQELPLLIGPNQANE